MDTLINWVIAPTIIVAVVAILLWQLSLKGIPKFSWRQATTATGTLPPAEPQIFFPDRNNPDGVTLWLKTRIDYYTELVEWKNREHELHTPKVYEWVYWLGCILVAFVFPALYVWAVKTWVPSISFAGTSAAVNPQWFLYLLPITYLIAGFRKVDTDEVAGADFFGKPVHQFDSGLKWVPWGLFGFNKEPTTYVEAEFPGDADLIQWSDEKTPLEPGRVRPIYLTTGEKPAKPGEERLPTDMQMNIGVAEYVQFQLVKSRFFDLEVNIGDIDERKRGEIQTTITGGADPTAKMLEAVRQMRDTSSAFLLVVLGQISLNEIRQHLALINQLLKLMLQAKVMDWGLEVVDGKITKLNGGHEFSKRIQDRADAIADRDAAITRAQGEKQKRILEGEGAAAAELASLKAKADGFEALAEKTKTKAGAQAMNAEVVRELAQAGNIVVVGPQGISDMFGLVKAAQKKEGKQP